MSDRTDSGATLCRRACLQNRWSFGFPGRASAVFACEHAASHVIALHQIAPWKRGTQRGYSPFRKLLDTKAHFRYMNVALLKR